MPVLPLGANTDFTGSTHLTSLLPLQRLVKLAIYQDLFFIANIKEDNINLEDAPTDLSVFPPITEEVVFNSQKRHICQQGHLHSISQISFELGVAPKPRFPSNLNREYQATFIKAAIQRIYPFISITGNPLLSELISITNHVGIFSIPYTGNYIIGVELTVDLSKLAQIRFPDLDLAPPPPYSC